MHNLETDTFDVIIIGTGISGLFTAFNLHPSQKVLMIAKDSFIECNTRKAKGGMAAAVYSPDNPESHFEDTLKAGARLNNPKAVQILTNEVIERIEELSEAGFLFDTNRDTGFYNLGLEGCHSYRRVLHAQGDRMGVAIFNFLFEKVSQLDNVTFMDHTAIQEINVAEDGFQSVSVISDNSKKQTLYGHSLVIASGGYSGMFKRNTSDDSFFGNMLSIAYSAGIGLTDLEFVQFHPTVFEKPGFETLLMSEAIRGEGAVLLNPNKKRFMDSYHEEAELASRDIVSQSIWKESEKCKSQDFYLDLTPIGQTKIHRLFPEVYENCLERGIDITKELVPIFPGAHYSMGGIYTDLYGRTTVDHIYAIGECSCNGTHGANRLASNSLIDSLVFGKRSAIVINDTSHRSKQTISTANSDMIQSDAPFSITNIRNLNWDYLGIVRDGEKLENYIQMLQPFVQTLSFSTGNDTARGNQEACLLSYLIARSAFLRKESRGAH